MPPHDWPGETYAAHCPPPPLVAATQPVPLLHTAHAPPDAPQAMKVVPSWQVPVESQQPSLHCAPELHAELHAPPRHARLSGQSAARPHPQVPDRQA